jgi:hypothetical protein
MGLLRNRDAEPVAPDVGCGSLCTTKYMTCMVFVVFARGTDLSGEQQTKTRRALECFSTRLEK